MPKKASSPKKIDIISGGIEYSSKSPYTSRIKVVLPNGTVKHGKWTKRFGYNLKAMKKYRVIG